MFSQAPKPLAVSKLNKLSLELFLKLGGLLATVITSLFLVKLGVSLVIIFFSAPIAIYFIRNSGARIIAAFYSVCYDITFTLILISQCAGPLSLIGLLLYWCIENVFLFFTFIIAVEICICAYFGALFIFARFFYFLLGLVFTRPDAVLAQLYSTFLFAYILFFTISFCIKVHFDIFGKAVSLLPELMPVVHAMPPSEQELFFTDLSKLVKGFGRSLFNGVQSDEQEYLASYLEPVIQKAISSLLATYNILPTPEVEASLWDLLSEHLYNIAAGCSHWSKGVKHEPLEGFCNTSLNAEKVYFYKSVCFKAYIDFFLGNPALFPDFNAQFRDNPDYSWYVGASYSDILEITAAKYEYNSPFECNDHLLMQTFIDDMRSDNDIATLALKNFFAGHSKASGSSSSFVPSEVLCDSPQSSSLNLGEHFLNHSKINVYKPQLVVVSSAGKEGFVNVFPKEAAQIKIGTASYEERLIKSWDNLADIRDNLSYWDRFQNWFYSNNLTDQEYSNKLQNTVNSKTQKLLLAGVKCPPINPATEKTTYLYPVKWHFVNEELCVKKTIKVPFLDLGDNFGVYKKNSLQTNINRLRHAIDAELVIAANQNKLHLLNSKRV